ncbi:GH21609 [Drosophila grimshawi]|uniref:GH21609 n=1 Tax=Drosophila grimshawi TaxID=7222 RepID=B4J529_DROGR|nr:GH21609 [Drosophila grimshawi]
MPYNVIKSSYYIYLTGSTTELAPSLLGFYDTLTNSLAVSGATATATTTTKADVHGTQAIGGSNQGSGESTPKRSNSNCSSSSNSSNTSNTSNNSNNSNHSSDNHSGSYTLQAAGAAPLQTPLVVAGLHDEADGVRLSRFRRQELGSSHSIASSASGSGATNSNTNSNPSPNCRRGNNIRVLSPNVQRIIAHADAVPVNAVDIEALQHSQSQQQQQQLLLPAERSPTPTRYIKASTPPKLKLSHLPLSKITGKLSTQSGSDLVSTLDASCDYSGSLSRKSTPVDEDKTPTNKTAPGTPFHFEGLPFAQLKLHRYETQQSIKLIEMEKLATTSMQLNATPPPTTPPRHKAFVVAMEPVSPEPYVDTINFDVVAQHIGQLALSDRDLGETNSAQELVEAINKPLIGKPLVRSVSAPRACQTYVRTKLKSQTGKANTLGGGMPLRLPTAEMLAELEEANKLSAESLDTLTDIKPKYPARLSELTRLNNRPLSSSSICSTSSSSSSGSDQLLNGKLTATSYLASVESLAESENELGDHHHHHHQSHTNPMSVLERACLEIVDSERSYVEDLGQVIKGYLLDWKERACLRLDELQILFANIEEIYEFNSMLLQQLINSNMEPGRIAKCFINLRERFNVYTTYCTSYPEAISLLTKLLQAKHTNSLLASTQKLLQHRLPLGSYLLKPVQRILKYHLLLDSLRKHCDVKEVAEAYAIMRQVAHNIDQVKRQQEQQSRVKELSGILDGWMGPDLSVLRELRHEGLLMEQHNKPRQVLLFDTMLIITKQKEDGRLQYKSLITQKNLMLSEHLPGEPTSFYVIPFDEPRNQIKLTARNRDQKRIWTQHIKGVMLEEFDIPTRARELVTSWATRKDQQQQQQQQCLCIMREQRSRTKSQSPVFSYKALKERSKSVPRIGGFSFDEHAEALDDDSPASLRGSKPDLSERKVKGKGFFEVKQYNHKTMPKRIATLKKQRGSSSNSGGGRKESCSKFYMDLSEFDSTVLKITESTEDLELAEEAQESPEPTQAQQYYETTTLSPAEKSKRDAEIVLDLLKNNKEFERIYNKNKQQKQRRDTSQATSSLSPTQEAAPPPLPPRPPSRSPPPLEAEQEQALTSSPDEQPDEPIYETLLRNVHVPYKFSPVLGRAKSVQYFKQREKRPAAPRPESDYVTLVYSPEGVLQRVGEDAVQQQHQQQQQQRDSTGSESSSGSTVKRDSQTTVINLCLDSNAESDPIDSLYSRPIPKNLMKRLLSTSGGHNSNKATLENVSHSEISLLPRALKSIDNLSMAFARSNRPPERRVSDVSEMCRQSILHRQGSEAVGERMAHVDYADPKTLFSIIASSEASLQRDSVFSLTSSSCTSSDSMCEQQRSKLPGSHFEYEQHVEDSLENDFRDSAIYSDDNNEKRSILDYDLKRPRSPPPPPPSSSSSSLVEQGSGLERERYAAPPQVAPKPTKAALQELLSQHPSVVLCPPHLSQTASRSWVLQQIENFNK